MPFQHSGLCAYLEEHIHHEDLVTLVSERIKTVRQTGKDTNQDADHHNALEERAHFRRCTDGHGVSKQEHA